MSEDPTIKVTNATPDHPTLVRTRMMFCFARFPSSVHHRSLPFVSSPQKSSFCVFFMREELDRCLDNLFVRFPIHSGGRRGRLFSICTLLAIWQTGVTREGETFSKLIVVFVKI